MARTLKYGNRMDNQKGNYGRYKAAANSKDIVRVVSKEYYVMDVHRVNLGPKNFKYANCPGPKKSCPVCKAGDETYQRAGLVIYHIGRRAIEGKSKAKVGEILAWVIPPGVQNELEDLMEEEGALNKFNIKITCRTERDATYQAVTVMKVSKPKLTAEDKQTIKAERDSVLKVFEPSSADYLNTIAALMTGEDPEDEDADDEEIEAIEEEDFDDDEFDEMLDEIEDDE